MTETIKATNDRGEDQQRVADTCVIPPTILDLNEASIFLGLSPNSILKKLKAGKFPQPVLVGGPNSWEAGWFYKDLIAYKTTYIDPFRDLRRGPDSAKAGSDQGSVVNGYPSTPLLRGDSGHSSQVWNAGSEHQGTLTPQGGETPPMVARLSQNCWLSNKREPSGGGVQLWQRGFLSMSGV